ncbi:MAG: hypothetical protein JSV56_04740, partial [Methanomassiliicoccales archaeon]
MVTKRGRQTIVLAAVLLSFLLSSSVFFILTASAQEYSFKVDEEAITITILEDGSIDIEYWITFINYEKMDGVDIGLPNDHYNLNSAEARVYVDNVAYSPYRIRKSPYIDIGVAIELDSNIRNLIEYKSGGKEFTIYLKINNPHMVYEDEKNPGNAGIRFRPTWFDPSFQQGSTRVISIMVILPPRLNNTDSVRYLEGHPYDSLEYNQTLL